MRESDAWFQLAELFYRHNGYNDFLCHQIAEGMRPDPGMGPMTKVDPAIRARMRKRITEDVGSYDGIYTRQAYPSPEDEAEAKEQKQARVLACLMFGWEARDSERGRPIRRQGRNHLNKGER